MSIPWMPLYVADYLADTAHLSASEHGAYLLLIMHYWRAGKLPTDERQLQRIARMTAREWANSRDTLAEFFDAEWRHKRIENELLKSQLKSTARAEAGSRGGKAKALKTLDAGLANATDLPQQNATDALASSSQSQSYKKDKPNGLSKKGCRLPEDWIPSSDDCDLAFEAGLSGDGIRRELARFRDYWRSVPGQKGVKLDWDATWRNWVRKAAEQRPRGQPPPKQAKEHRNADFIRNLAEIYHSDPSNPENQSRPVGGASTTSDAGLPDCGVDREISLDAGHGEWRRVQQGGR